MKFFTLSLAVVATNSVDKVSRRSGKVLAFGQELSREDAAQQAPELLKKWKAAHRNNQSQDCEETQLLNFRASLQDMFDAQEAQPNCKFTIDNELAILSKEERNARNTYVPRGSKKRAIPHVRSLQEIPLSYDAVVLGYVAPIKNQGNCGSCWAFSANAAIEGVNAKLNGMSFNSKDQVTLSEQHVMDCGYKEGASPCSGGSMEPAYRFMLENGGSAGVTLGSYPYTGADNATCKSGAISGIEFETSNYVEVSENDIKDALVTHGVLAAALEVDAEFYSYSEGVFTVAQGSPNHAIAIVGYGVDSDGTSYWKIKNSWGESFGEDGYIRIKQESGALVDISYPILKSTAATPSPTPTTQSPTTQSPTTLPTAPTSPPTPPTSPPTPPTTLSPITNTPRKRERDGTPHDGSRDGTPHDGSRERDGTPRDGSGERDGSRKRDGTPRDGSGERDGSRERDGTPRDARGERDGSRERDGTPRDGSERDGSRQRDRTLRDASGERDGSRERDGTPRDARGERDVSPERDGTPRDASGERGGSRERDGTPRDGSERDGSRKNGQDPVDADDDQIDRFVWSNETGSPLCPPWVNACPEEMHQQFTIALLREICEDYYYGPGGPGRHDDIHV